MIMIYMIHYTQKLPSFAGSEFAKLFRRHIEAVSCCVQSLYGAIPPMPPMPGHYPAIPYHVAPYQVVCMLSARCCVACS